MIKTIATLEGLREELEKEFGANRALHDWQFDGPYVFFLDLGSVLTLDMDAGMERASAALIELSRIARAHWHWGFVERGVYDDQANTSIATDWKRELWINFASPDDAMLSRITLVDLRNAKHADSRGLPSRP